MRTTATVIAVAATAYAAPIAVNSTTPSAVISFGNVLDQLEIPPGGTIARKGQDSIFSLTPHGKVYGLLTFTTGEYVDTFNDRLIVMEKIGDTFVNAVPPTESQSRPNETVSDCMSVEKHQFKIPPGRRPFVDESNKVEARDNTLDFLEIDHLSLGLVDRPNSSFRKGRKVSERSDHNLRDVVNMLNAQDVPKNRCSPHKYCVDSAGCRGACNACTYISWFPYGFCMARENNMGRIVD